MKRELGYFSIGRAYGGVQKWLSDAWMRLGGCAAVTACDCSIYFSLYNKKNHLYPYDVSALTRSDYIHFSEQMEPYLRPRISGIDRLDIYQEGYGQYLRDCGERHLKMELLPGTVPLQTASEKISQQIDTGMPIPCLILRHANPEYRDYVWHWFLLTGYEKKDGQFLIKAVTYGKWRWLNLAELWDTGYEKKGGLILFKA